MYVPAVPASPPSSLTGTSGKASEALAAHPTMLFFFSLALPSKCIPLSLLLTNRPGLGDGCPGDQTLATGVNDL